MPSVFCAWAFDVLRDFCELAPERATVRLMDREDEVDESPDRNSVLYLSHFPGASFRAQWVRAEAPTILFLDDPVDSVRYVRQSGTGSVVDALRMQTAAAASFAELRDHPGRLILHRFTEASAAAIIDAILEHLALEPTPDQRETIYRRRIGPEGVGASLEAALAFSVQHYAPLGEPQSVLDARQIGMVADVLSPLIQMSFRDSPGPVIWPIETFFSGDQPNTPAQLVTDLTGGARILYYGPYFHLPAGFWKVRMMVGFSAGARSMPFSAEVYAGEQPLAFATMVPENKGVYHATFSFAHDLPDRAIEVRLRTDRGAIEGRVALGRVEFTREQADRRFSRAAAG